ncbi:MAG: 3-phosphoshikimate 1-carboxyvinyltransferase, partial [Planctomycetota bacterium]
MSVRNETTVELKPVTRICGDIQPPGSKSLTNRALIVASVASGSSRIEGALVSEDTEVMIESLRRAGVKIEVSGGGTILDVEPISIDQESSARQDAGTPVELFIANSGTSVRFLAAMLSVVGGHYRLSGVPRMHQRPIGDLVEALKPLVSGQIVAESEGGCPPVTIESSGWKGEATSVGGGVSSQYLSGLMMAGGAKMEATTICIDGELVSKPYVKMT